MYAWVEVVLVLFGSRDVAVQVVTEGPEYDWLTEALALLQRGTFPSYILLD